MATKVLTDISSTAWEHPADRAALNALPIRAGVHPLAFSKLAGALSALALVLVPLTRLNSLHRHPSARLAAAGLVAVAPVMAFYAVSGMEESFFVLVVTVGWLLYLRSFRGARRDILLAAATLLGFGFSGFLHIPNTAPRISGSG